MRFAAVFVAEGFLAEIGDPPVNFQIHALKIVQLRGKVENLLRQRALQIAKVCGLASSLSWRIS